MLTARIVAGAAAREEQERPAREAAQRANDERSARLKAEWDAEQQRERQAYVAAQERGEALRKTIYSYVKPMEFLGAPDKWQINKLRTDGHSEGYIAQQVMPYRNKLLATGAPKEVADEYFGGDPFLKPGVKP